MDFASLFSGCGGFDIGFAAAGFRSRAAYDSDPDAIRNFASNIDGPVRNADLTQGIPNEHSLLKTDVLIAGPPCQGFSTMGKRLLHDDRNHLTTLTGELARRIEPKVLVVENVPGALAGEHARYLSGLEGKMRLAGYRTHIICCQSADLGMAQLRRRVLFFAWRTQMEVNFILPKLPHGTVRVALAGASSQPNHHPQRLKRGSRELFIAKRIGPGQKLTNVRASMNSVPTWSIPEVFGWVKENERTVLELLRGLRRQERKRDYGDADPVSLPRLEAALGRRFQRLVDTLITKGYLRRLDGGIDLVGTFNGKFRRLTWDKPSYTVDTRFGSPRYFLHPSQQRGFSVREAARLQGFADDYIFSGAEAAQFRLIGNAVPPPLGYLAAVFAKHLLGRS